jgi:hypothetical protein
VVTDRAPTVVFDVLLRAPGRRRREGELPSLEDRPTADTIERARRWLAARGVVCHATTAGLACEAPASVFEKIFRVGVAPNPTIGRDEPPVVLDGEIHVPAELADVVERVTLPRPPTYFA